MSISLEALKRLNLTADQLRLVQAEAAQNAVQLDDPSSMEASLSQILCTSTGLSRFSTDPIAKAAFMKAPPKPVAGGGGGGMQRRSSMGNLKTKIQSLTSSRSFEDLRRSADSVLNGGEDGTRSRDPRRMYQDDDSESVLSPRLRKIRSQEYLSGYSPTSSAAGYSPHASSMRSPPTMGMAAEWEERRRLKSPYGPLGDDVKAAGLFSPTASSTSDSAGSGRSTNSSVRSGSSKASSSSAASSSSSNGSSRSRSGKASGPSASSRYQSGSECSEDYSSYSSSSSSCTSSSYHSEAASSAAHQHAPPSPSLSNQSVLSRVSLADRISVPSSPAKAGPATLGGPSLLPQPRPLALAPRRMPAVPPPTRAGGRVSFSKGGPVAAMAALRRQSASRGSVAPPPSFHAPPQSPKVTNEQSRPQSPAVQSRPSTPASSQYSSSSGSSLASPVHPRHAQMPPSAQATQQQQQQQYHHQYQQQHPRQAHFFEDEVVALASPHYSQTSPSSYEVSSQPTSSSDPSSYATSSYASSPSASSAYASPPSSALSPVELYQQQLLSSPKPVRRLDPAQIAAESGSNVSAPKPFYASPPQRQRPSLIPPVVSERIPVFEHPQPMPVPQHRPLLTVATPVVAERKPIFEHPQQQQQQQQQAFTQHRPSLVPPVVAERKPLFEHPQLHHQQAIPRQRPSLEIGAPVVAERKPVFEHPQQALMMPSRERAVSIEAPVVSERRPFFERHQPQEPRMQQHRVSLEQPGIVQERRPLFDGHHQQPFQDRIQHIGQQQQQLYEPPSHVDYQQQYCQQLQQGQPLASQYQTPLPQHLPSTAPLIHQLQHQHQQEEDEDAFATLAQRRPSLEHLQYADHVAPAIQAFASSSSPSSSVESPGVLSEAAVSPFLQMMRAQGKYRPSGEASTPSSMETPSSAMASSGSEAPSPSSSSSYYTESPSAVASPMANVEHHRPYQQQQHHPQPSPSYTVHRNPYAQAQQPQQQPQQPQQQQHFVFHQHHPEACSPAETASGGTSYYSSDAQSCAASPSASHSECRLPGLQPQQVMPQGPSAQQMASRPDHQQQHQPVQVPLTHQYQPTQPHQHQHQHQHQHHQQQQQQVYQGAQRQSSPLAQHQSLGPSLEDHVLPVNPASPAARCSPVRSGATGSATPECQAIRPASSTASLAKSGINLADLIVELDISDPAVGGDADPYGSFAELSKKGADEEGDEEDSQQQQQQQDEYYGDEEEDEAGSSWYASDASSGAVYSEPAYYGHPEQHRLSPLSPLSQAPCQPQGLSPLRRTELSQADLLDIEAEFVEQPAAPVAMAAGVPRQPQTLSPLLPALQGSPSMASRFHSKYGSGMLASSGSQVTMLGSAGSCCADELGSIDLRSQDSLRRAVSFAPELQSLNDPACTDLLALRRQGERESQLYLNYRNAMRNAHTALPLSFQEVKEKIGEHGLEIAFREERHTADQKSLFLLPLNGLAQPRWVPPNTSLRVGRSSAWLQAQSRVVSRNHCEILHDIHQYYVRDVGSKSGTFVNGTRIGTPDTISAPRELRHGDVLQIGTDLGSEADAYGRVPDTFRSVQLLALYGYRARLSVPAKDEITEMRPQRTDSEVNGKTISMSSSKCERLSRKAKSQRSRLASANTRVYLEFGDLVSDTAAGTAVFLRPDGEPSYSFIFNNYKLTWDISMTAEDGSRRILLLTAMPGAEGLYQVITGRDGGKVVATLSVQSEHKLLLEPVHDCAAQPLIDTSPPPPPPADALPEHIPSPFSPAASFLAPQSSSTLFSIPSATTSRASGQLSPVVSPSPPFALPFYTLTGSIPDASLIFYIRRFPGSRAQAFLGEGQLSAKKSSWGKKMLFYEARLPPAERDDDLLALATLFNLLSQTERAAAGTP